MPHPLLSLLLAPCDLSARMRQSGATLSASPLLTLQIEDESYFMDWMEPNGTAWQWVSMDATISAALTGVDRNATVIMNVTLNGGATPDGVVYFDDVSVAPITFECESSDNVVTHHVDRPFWCNCPSLRIMQWIYVRSECMSYSIDEQQLM